MIADLFLYLVFILFLLSLAGYLYYISFSSQAGPVYQPSSMESVKRMLNLAKVGRKDRVLDLGSGDGRIIIEAGRKGAEALGYEIDPILFFRSRLKIARLELRDRVKVKLKSFWKADFSWPTVITLYLLPKYLRKLRGILEREIDRPVLVVSNVYKIPGKRAIKKEGEVYLYRFTPKR